MLQHVVLGLCGKKEHLARACRSKEQTDQKLLAVKGLEKQSINLLAADPLEKDEDVEDMYALFNVSDGSLAPRLELQWRLIS